MKIEDFLSQAYPEEFDFKNEMAKYYESYNKSGKYTELIDDIQTTFKNSNQVQNNISKFLAYKTLDVDFAKQHELNFDFFDCDSWNGTCELTSEIYHKLWDWSSGVVNASAFRGCFGGDTMNSLATTMIECLKGCEQLDKKPSINVCKHKYEESDTFRETLHANGFNEFAKYAGCIGNFVLVPKGFNGTRYTRTFDFWDSSLAWLKQEDFPDGTKKKAVFNKNDFNRYINYFYLWDYVERKDENEYNIKPLFEAHKDIEHGNWSNIPAAEIQSFLKKVCTYIKKRGIFMTILLRLKTADSPELKKVSKGFFEDIQGEAFLRSTHDNGYQSALNILENKLPNPKQNDSDVSKIRDDISRLKEIT